jgi:hypothetical protein
MKTRKAWQMIDYDHDSGQIDRKVIRALLTVDPGWASLVELSWNVAHEDVDGRRVARAVISSLVRQGVLDNLYIRHANKPIEIVHLDHAALRNYLGDEQ